MSPASSVAVRYSQDIEDEIARLSDVIRTAPELSSVYHPRWLAIQLLEHDHDLLNEVSHTTGGEEVVAALNDSLGRLRHSYGDELDVILTDQRYSFVNTLVGEVVTRPVEKKMSMSVKIDQIVTDQRFGIPIFLVLMWVVFKVTTDVSAPYVDWIDGVIGGPVANQVVAMLGALGLENTWVASLAVNGVLAGVGGVLVFVPVLMSLYFALALLEDTGYMARAAFVMDRLMKLLGLQGKSFLPMVVGFGCTVPAFYATRTLENEKERILTGLLVPFMSCSARLPVYVLIATIFFPRYSGMVIFAIYLTGILIAIVLGFILRRTMFKDKETMPFIMELPPYRLPSLTNVWQYMWERTSSFLQQAWSIILVISMIIWLLTSIPTSSTHSFAHTPLPDSGFAALARGISPIFAPLGFGSWETSGALVSGIVAKEAIVSTMSQVYQGSEDEAPPEPAPLSTNIRTVATSFVGATIDTVKSLPLIVGINLFDEAEDAEPTGLANPIHRGFEESSNGRGTLAALAFMVFVLLYSPCMVSAAAERQELGVRWMWVSIVGQFILAWLAAYVIFQGGLLLGLGG
jgi:ferrous iron transport protein B